jgi:hypothetical protein
MVLHPNPTNKLVRTQFAPFWCWDKPRATLNSLDSPRPKLGGSHHLPPYSILCSPPPHLHPNGSFSRDSQSGVSKLSRFGLPGLWALVTSCPKLRSGWGLSQSCSSPQELSNGVSHLTYTNQNRVDSWLLVVGSQTAYLTIWLPPLLSTITCAADVQMAHARPFWTSTFQDLSNGIKNVSMWSVLTPWNRALNFWESRRTPKSHFRECEWWPHNSLKVGLQHVMFLAKNVSSFMFGEQQFLTNFSTNFVIPMSNVANVKRLMEVHNKNT